MSFGLGRGRRLDIAPGTVAIDASELPPLPDDILTSPQSGWVDVRSLFKNPAQPLELEIGCGKGAFLLQQGEDEPGTNFLGVEWAGEFFAYAADRVRRRGLPNVRLLHGDATEFLRWRVPDGELRVVHLYFSDPWPKSRHHKNRVVQDRFLTDVWRTLEPGGGLRLVTDHDELWAWYQNHFARWCEGLGVGGMRFDQRAFAPVSSAGAGELVGSNFERKYRREGRPFHGATLVKPIRP